jgi:hypothetical protein
MLNRDLLRELATAEPGRPVLSIYARTDPRDPANAGRPPAWQIAARNGLRDVAEQVEAEAARDDRLAFRELREKVESELASTWPDQRARSFAWFAGVEGEPFERLTLQLPVRADAIVWDDRPFVSPLVDVGDRGAPVGALVVDGETVRFVHIEQGEATEPDESTFEISTGDWRRFGGTAGGSPRRGLHTTAHQERYEARVDKQRKRLFTEAGAAAARRLDELGWERVILVAEDQAAAEFTDELPTAFAARVAARVVANLGGQEAHAIADACEPVIEELWLTEVTGKADLAYERARAGAAAALGVADTTAALEAGSVDRLLVDPAFDVGDAGRLFAERSIETAVATGARVSCLPPGAAEGLAEAGGIAALLRY